MSIYEGSRYINVYTYEEEYKGKVVTAFNIRENANPILDEAIKHTWIEGDRLDNLSARYYGKPIFWWFILDANTKYMEEEEIQNGDILFIPPYSELAKIVEDDSDGEE